MVQFENITKLFGGVTALDDVSVTISRGECHCLMGENGAGKSTLGKILAGIHRPDSGRLIIDGTPRAFHSPADALAAGVGMVHQELAFCPQLSVAENLCMGAYPRRQGLFLDRPTMRQRARTLLARVGAGSIDVDRPMRELSTAMEQLVQIASAIGTNARIIIFDEPTSSLSEVDAQNLLRLIRELQRDGVTIVYVSHRMPEVLQLADRISVLRDGKFVETLSRDEATQDRLIHAMIGRRVEAFAQATGARSPVGPPVLRVSGLASRGKFDDINLDIHSGEVVGMAGLIGSGRSEIAQAIFGLDKLTRGHIVVDGEPMRLRDVRLAKGRGIGLVPEDRKRQGLVLGMSCLENFTLSMLDKLSTAGFLRRSQSTRQAEKYFARLNVKTPSLHTAVGNLSGGNQQKVALAKWLGRDCRVLLIDEPTRGVDVGAKQSIHQLIAELAASGLAILLISSELPELLALADRIVVMREGRLVAQVPAGQATQESVLKLMAGVVETNAPSDH